MGIVDGLGGEEVNQDVNVQTGSVIATGPISGAGNVYGANVITSGSVTADNARLNTVSLGSPGGTGALIQAGSVGTGAGSEGFIAFRTNFGDAEYSVSINPWSGNSAGGNTFTSGVQNVSGVMMIGEDSERYQYIAVGRP